MKKAILIIFGLVACGLGGFFGVKTLTDNKYGTPNLNNGKKRFLSNCAVCHGEKVLGDGVVATSLAVSPDNIHDEVTSPFGMKAELIASVLEGDNGQDGTMPLKNKHKKTSLSAGFSLNLQ
ncbi:c-type cytochrome [Photobacterium sp. J15]|uniref:c-type cytochrome n=1 Tax=Photobacterium sp. J15 TaxID=265901 RepID=UPI0007E4AC27|nr:c-type cytochrome [Photobacterium sp. J15]